LETEIKRDQVYPKIYHNTLNLLFCTLQLPCKVQEYY